MIERMKSLYALSQVLSESRREDDTRQTYVRRRRAWLWRPLMLAGMALAVWQLTSGEPAGLLVLLGIVMCLPWVVDV